MRAMVLDRPGTPLRLVDLPVPKPGNGAVLIEVEACGVCRTDLHLIDGELPDPVLPMIPGHEIVGRVVAIGDEVTGFLSGQRVGVPWLGWTCGECRFCTSGRENLCDAARFTGYQINGGYAEYTVADARYCFPLPDAGDAAELAPLLCAGLIGYRALRLAGDSHRFGNLRFRRRRPYRRPGAKVPGARVSRLHPPWRYRESGVCPQPRRRLGRQRRPRSAIEVRCRADLRPRRTAGAPGAAPA